MTIRSLLYLALFCSTSSVLLAEDAPDARPKQQTTITIKGLHCAGCARKVTRALKGVKHVSSATVDAKSGKAIVVPLKDRAIVPKSLWAAIEAAGYTPTKIVGPGGTFTKKPE